MENNEQKQSLYVDSLPRELTIDVLSDDVYYLNIACFEKLEKEISVTVNVHENGTLIGAMADFTPLSCSFHLQVNLLGE